MPLSGAMATLAYIFHHTAIERDIGRGREGGRGEGGREGGREGGERGGGRTRVVTGTKRYISHFSKAVE